LSSVIRGHVYTVALGELRKPYLVVSNNARNYALGSFLGVRLTTTAKPDLASIIKLSQADHPLVGSVLCDDIDTVYEEEIVQHLGALAPETMMRVDAGLRTALALR
jgi:mRNA interferase MazF